MDKVDQYGVPTWSWTCNECGAREFTPSVSEDDVYEMNCHDCDRAAELEMRWMTNREEVST